MTDEDALTYEPPVPVAGTVEIKMGPSVEAASSYADNEVWIDKQQDNGGTGTMSFYDVESTPELRSLIARLVGYQIAEDGRTILSADVSPVPFGFMCEQPGHVMGKRRCLYKCQFSKPSTDAKTIEDKPDITQLDFEFTWRVVKLPSGVRASGYDSYSGLADYDKFFEKVDTAIAPKAAAAPASAPSGGSK